MPTKIMTENHGVSTYTLESTPFRAASKVTLVKHLIMKII